MYCEPTVARLVHMWHMVASFSVWLHLANCQYLYD